ncbi:MAG: hypothetical protein IJV88_01295 [Ruminococcus sp.]|nr:hypothetical protein [Ruminococcus sp.]
MKKFLVSFLTVMLLLTSLCSTIVSVGAFDDEWVMGERGKYITHGDQVYYPLESCPEYIYSYTDDVQEYERLEFEDDETEDRYDGSGVYFYEDGNNPAIEVEVFVNFSFSRTVIYIEESYLEKYKELANGEAEQYLTNSYYDYEQNFEFDGEEIESWRESSTTTNEEVIIADCDVYYLYVKDPLGVYNFECGTILRDLYTDDLYLIWYDDYDISYFYSESEFDLSTEKEVTLYKLEDEALYNSVIEYYDTMPEDELEWLVTDEVNTTFATVFCTIVFGIVPFGLLVFSTVMLIISKDKKYNRAFIIMIIGSVVVMTACIGLFTVLL